MSISRKNWSALSSLTRQWTVEDEEEIERERRRKIRSHGSTAEFDDSSAGNSVPAEAETPSAQDSYDGLEQAQLDFVEMLRMREEKRRRRQEEALRQQHQEEEAKQGTERPGVEIGQQKQVDRENETEEQEGQRQNQDTTPKELGTTNNKGSNRNRRSESKQEEQPETPTKTSRKFVSSFSISFNKNQKSPAGGSSTVTSPLSPTGSFRAASPEQVPADVSQNGDTQESPLASPSEGPTAKQQTPFKRQNYRAWSFRVMRKKEQQSVPFQRRTLWCIIMSEPCMVSLQDYDFLLQTTSHEDDQQSPFKRNSRQRLSSRSIQETMEKLALAVQKSEIIKSPTTPRGPLYLVDEVSRKRELFEKEQVDGESDKGDQVNILSSSLVLRPHY
ncbi:ladinin-1 [Arapaima gigas]